MHQLRAIKKFVRNLFAREVLEEAIPHAPARTRRQLAAMLLHAEPLARDPERSSPRSTGILRSLFAPEVLPEDPPEPRAAARPGLLGALFVPETLPELPVQPRRVSRSAWLRWLFHLERLDPP